MLPNITERKGKKMSNYVCYGPVNPIKIAATGTLPERTCYDFYEHSNHRESTDSKEVFFQDALFNKDQLFQWAQIAYQIFQSEPQSYWDHSGKGWEGNFGKSANYMDLIDLLCNKHERSSGDDVHLSTGLSLANSLNEVEQIAGMVTEQLINRKLKANQFINRCNLEPFHDNKESQTIFYSIAGHRDRYGKTFQYGYNVFGLAFYNFRLKVVNDGKPYNTAIGELTVEEAAKKGNIPGFTYKNTGSGITFLYPAENRNSEEASQTVQESQEVSKSESNSIVNSKEYSFTEMVGASVELEDVLKVSKVTLTMQFTAGQVISTAYTEEKSVTKTKNNSSSITVTIPPHTAIVVSQKNDNTVTTLQYDCPVMVQFDVAVFSMCGTCYDDNAAVQSFSTAGYDQRSFITLFQPSKAGNAGEDASENLYMRYTNYAKVTGYDKIHGVTQLKSHYSGLLKDQLNWDKILQQTKASTNYKGTEGKGDEATLAPKLLIEKLTQNRPMSPTGGTLTEIGESIVSKIESALPLYPLYILRQSAGSAKYDVGVNDDLYPNNWIVIGYDKNNIPFYGFDFLKGHWILVDENGTALKDDPLAYIGYDKFTNEPYIRGKSEAVIYAKYLIPENYYTCQEGTVISNKNIQTVFVKITIHDTRLKGTIIVSGSVEVKNNTITNLETLNTINVQVYDDTQTQIVVPIIWEAEEGHEKNITIIHNKMSVHAVGNYRIRARYEDLISDEWIEVHVTE